MKLKRRQTKRGRIEVIPMIDAILILLIFYMSFSSFSQTEKRIDAKLPVTARTTTTLPSTGIPLDVNIKVVDKDKVIVNGSQQMTLLDLQGYMAQLGQIGQQSITVVIEGEPKTPYGDVVGALDACAQAKLDKVAFRPLKEDAAAPK